MVEGGCWNRLMGHLENQRNSSRWKKCKSGAGTLLEFQNAAKTVKLLNAGWAATCAGFWLDASESGCGARARRKVDS